MPAARLTPGGFFNPASGIPTIGFLVRGTVLTAVAHVSRPAARLFWVRFPLSGGDRVGRILLRCMSPAMAEADTTAQKGDSGFDPTRSWESAHRRQQTDAGRGDRDTSDLGDPPRPHGIEPCDADSHADAGAM